jgi:hypothetical protein
MRRREIMDVMQEPKRFDVGYSIGFLYAYLGLTIPHSVAVNLAYPAEIPVNGELLLWRSMKTIFKVQLAEHSVHVLTACTKQAFP